MCPAIVRDEALMLLCTAIRSSAAGCAGTSGSSWGASSSPIAAFATCKGAGVEAGAADDAAGPGRICGAQRQRREGGRPSPGGSPAAAAPDHAAGVRPRAAPSSRGCRRPQPNADSGIFPALLLSLCCSSCTISGCASIALVSLITGETCLRCDGWSSR